jgi:hypothetical protein
MNNTESRDTATSTYIRPLHEILELLGTSSDGEPIRFRVKPDRRMREDGPPDGRERRLNV